MVEEKPTKPTIIVPEGKSLVIKPGTPSQEQPQGNQQQISIPEISAVLPVRNTVVFPGTMMPLVIGRAKSRKLIEDVLPDQRVIVLVAQKDASVENPTPDDLYEHGTAVVILKLLRTSEEAQTIIVHGLVRVHIEEYVQTEPYFRARITPLEEQVPEGKEIEARLIDVRQKALRIVQLSPNIPDEAQMVINSIDQPGALADFLAANLVSDVAVKQELLAETNVLKRLERLEKLSLIHI